MNFLPVELSIVISWLSGSFLVVVYPHTLTSTTRSLDVIHVICVLAQCVILNTNWRTKKQGTGFLLGGPLLALTCLPPLGYAENPINLSLYKSFTAIINGKLCLCENSPRFYQIASNKIKLSGGHTPGPSYFATCFAHRYVLALPIIYTISFCCLPPPPWAKSWKKPWGRLGNESTNLLDINHNLLS